MKQRIKAILLMVVLLFCTVTAPLLQTMSVNAAGDLVLKLHFLYCIQRVQLILVQG